MEYIGNNDLDEVIPLNDYYGTSGLTNVYRFRSPGYLEVHKYSEGTQGISIWFHNVLSRYFNVSKNSSFVLPVKPNMYFRYYTNSKPSTSDTEAYFLKVGPYPLA